MGSVPCKADVHHAVRREDMVGLMRKCMVGEDECE